MVKRHIEIWLSQEIYMVRQIHHMCQDPGSLVYFFQRLYRVCYVRALGHCYETNPVSPDDVHAYPMIISGFSEPLGIRVGHTHEEVGSSV